jgi:hypothetical protein
VGALLRLEAPLQTRLLAKTTHRIVSSRSALLLVQAKRTKKKKDL